MSHDSVRAPHLFTLTKITGRRRTDDRTIVVSSFEVNRRHLNVFLLGLIPTFIATGAAATVIGVYALLVATMVMVAWFFLVERRSQVGLRTRTWRTIVDRKRTLAGKFIQCGVVVEDGLFADYQILRASVPLARASLADETVAVLTGGREASVASCPPQPPTVTAARPYRRRNSRVGTTITSRTRRERVHDLDDLLPGGAST